MKLGEGKAPNMSYLRQAHLVPDVLKHPRSLGKAANGHIMPSHVKQSAIITCVRVSLPAKAFGFSCKGSATNGKITLSSGSCEMLRSSYEGDVSALHRSAETASSSQVRLLRSLQLIPG